MVFSLKVFWAIAHRATGNAIVKCKICGQMETFKRLDLDGSHSYKCGCGCSIYRFHGKDEFNEFPFFLKSFVSKKDYISNYKKGVVSNAKV